MYAGFDYGTSNCAVGVVRTPSSSVESRESHQPRVELLAIEQGKAFMPSTLYALERELICEYAGQHIDSPELKDAFIALRSNQLNQARRIRREHDIRNNDQSIFVGQDAFDQYLSFPGDGYFVKSPKSFLGASGLRADFILFFEDIVTAMMQTIKARAQAQLQDTIDHAVIGRPVNFQGANAENSNRQAIDILSLAAKRAGFRSVEFLYEPLAAGLDFESRLTQNKTVLVVDIGGGTSDCAMVRMGPDHRDKTQRSDDFLAHSGERIGGNDLDIQLAGQELMPLFGMNSALKNGLSMPTQAYWNAVKTNDVGAQSIFNSLKTEQSLRQLMLDTTEPQLLKRFIHLREQQQNHQLVRSAEQGKIALSSAHSHECDLNYIEEEMHCMITQEQFANAIQRPIRQIVKLMEEAIKQAGCKPDLIYITGGSAQSPVIRSAIQESIGEVDIVDGNHFGSVATGLTVWAQRLFS
jgi:hypothetical chaperone protein